MKNPWKIVAPYVNDAYSAFCVTVIPYAANLFCEDHPRIYQHLPFGSGRFVRDYTSDIFGSVFYATFAKGYIENAPGFKKLRRFSTEAASVATMIPLTLWEVFKTVAVHRPFDTGNMKSYCAGLALWCIAGRIATRTTKEQKSLYFMFFRKERQRLQAQISALGLDAKRIKRYFPELSS